MKRALVILEDDAQYREVATGFLDRFDPSIVRIEVATVEDAKEAIQHPETRLHEASRMQEEPGGINTPGPPAENVVVVGALIDLLIEANSLRQSGSPVEQGIDFIKWLRANSLFAKIPVLILSAHEEMIAEVQRTARREGQTRLGRINIVSRNQDFGEIRGIVREFIESL